MPYQFTVTCVVCGEFAALLDITQVDDQPYAKAWDRVMMGCGDSFTLRSVDAAQIGLIAAGVLDNHAFPHPDRGDFIIVGQGPAAQ